MKPELQARKSSGDGVEKCSGEQSIQEEDTLDGEGEATGQRPHRNEAGDVRFTHTCPSGNLETSWGHEM